MQDHVSSAATELTTAASTKAVVVTNSTIATGLVVTSEKPEIVTETTTQGAWLATHYIGPLNGLEVIQVIGAVYVTYTLTTAMYDRFSKYIRSRKNGKSSGQQTEA